MAPITIFKHTTGDWITEWRGKNHLVSFNETDGLSFVTLGLLDLPAVRFDVNPRGVIMGVYDNRTDRELAEVTFPIHHSLHREINIGKPV